MTRWRLPLAHGRSLAFDHPLVMGILNVTPDSFSDGGRHDAPDSAAARAGQMLAEGADILDIGGESTRPGAAPVTAEDETARVVPAIDAIREAHPEAVISLDTSKAAVAAAGLAAGADLVNDVTGFGDPEMAGVVKEAGCAVVLMRDEDCPPGDLVAYHQRRFREMATKALGADIQREAIVLDPGLGFGKRPGADPVANGELVRRLPELTQVGYPVLVGASRKRFIGAATGVEAADQRVAGSVAAAVAAAVRGAAILRVHDVAPTVEALRMARYL
ncbi:MAG: dihydropteroate synthase [Thermoplasmatota archaeon]